MAGVKNWSYSSATMFEKCPKQYYHLNVVKDVKQDFDAPHFAYGNEVHKAAELYIGSGVPLPTKFEVFQRPLDMLNNIPGKKYCEFRLGLTRDLEPVEFFGDGVWWRGIIDLLIIDEDSKTATLIDYKTGKSSRFADTRQLSLLSAAVFKHFPNIETVKAGLMFLVSKELIKEDFKHYSVDDMIGEWDTTIKRLDTAIDTNVFNPSPNFACKSFCPVEKCQHWGKG
tara:strand:- start:7770 stop:8447 length:678 start_codon:yes stop_codon:yes gene_type:complete